MGPLFGGWIVGRRALSIRGGISVAARWPSGGDFGGHARHCVGFRSLLRRHHDCELEIPLCPPDRFFNRDYGVFDCSGVAFSEADLKPLIRVCSNLPGEPHRTQLSGVQVPLLADRRSCGSWRATSGIASDEPAQRVPLARGACVQGSGPWLICLATTENWSTETLSTSSGHSPVRPSEVIRLAGEQLRSAA